MKISNNKTFNFERTVGYTKENLNSKTFVEKMEEAKIDKSRTAENIKSNRDIYVTKNNEDLYDVLIYGKKNIENQLELPIETERYKIELCNNVEGVQAYLIHDKLLGKQLYIREDELAIQRDGGTGMEFIINMDQPFCMKLQVTDELKCILHEIETKRNIDIQEIPMQGGLYVNRDPKTGIQYLAIRGNEGKGAGLLITSEKEMEVISNLMNEFQQYSVSSQESTAGLYAMLEITGNLRRGNDGFTFLTPNGITYIPYDGDTKKAWEINMSEQNYSAARERLAAGMDFENNNANANIETEKLKSKTDSNIVVNADGSRVLIITMTIGGMETSMSIELSKPTELQNGTGSMLEKDAAQLQQNFETVEGNA